MLYYFKEKLENCWRIDKKHKSERNVQYVYKIHICKYMANIENIYAKRFESVNLLQRYKPTQQKNWLDFCCWYKWRN